MGNVTINGKTAVHAGSGGVLQTQDICKSGGKCKPRNYTNVALSADSSKTASTVFVNGNPVCHAKSTFAKSMGDEAGNCGGKKSGTIKKMAEFLTSSPNVMIEGQSAVRQGDQMVSNMRNTPPAPLKQPGAAAPSWLDANEAEEADPAEAPDELAWESNVNSAFPSLKIGLSTDGEE